MKSILIIVFVFVAMNVFSQEQYLSISRSGSEKETVFKENARVRIKTVQGGKIKGRLHFVDETQVMIKNIGIPVTNISQIKHDPLILNIFISGTLIAAGGFFVFAGIYAIAWGAIGAGLGVSVGGAGMMFAGILTPNFLPNVHVNNNASIKTANLMQ